MRWLPTRHPTHILTLVHITWAFTSVVKSATTLLEVTDLMAVLADGGVLFVLDVATTSWFPLSPPDSASPDWLSLSP